MKKKLLLHACCGPCSSGALYKISSVYDVTIFYYNPNIYPQEEYLKRLDALKSVIVNFNSETNSDVKLIVGNYDTASYQNYINGLENELEGGKRCTKCFELRLNTTAQFAKENNFDCFTTTLSISPHKNAELLNEIGHMAQTKYNIEYIDENFKKQNGFLDSINNSKRWNIYRQQYCGCKYSIHLK